MEYTRIPQNTFRPIREGLDLGFQIQIPVSRQTGFNISSPMSPLSPTSRPAPKISKSWRQGSETWSSAGSRPESSAAQSCSTPTSTHLYSRSGNSSNSDVSVARNFQQLSVSTRRAAFKTQKWSQSFDQTCSNSSPSAPKRRQTSFQHKSLDLDSGYLGSPANGLVNSQNQSWTENVPVHSQQQGAEPSTDATLELDEARRELADLISSQQTESINRSLSLPSFSTSFQNSSQQETSHNLSNNLYFPETSSRQDELDELDEEIKQIVGDIRSPGLQTFIPPSHYYVPTKECLKPTPIRSSTLTFTPEGNSSIEESGYLTHSAGRVEVSSPPANISRYSKDPEPAASTPSGYTRDQYKEVPAPSPDPGSLQNLPFSGGVMLAVVSTVSQKYQVPRIQPSSSIQYIAGTADTSQGLQTAAQPSQNSYISEVVNRTGGGSESCVQLDLGLPARDTYKHQFVFKKTSQFSGKQVYDCIMYICILYSSALDKIFQVLILKERKF